MPRLRQVTRAEAPPEVLEMYNRLFGDRDPVAQPGTATGTPGNWWTVFALVPDIFQSAVAQFGMFNSKRRQLSPYFRERRRSACDLRKSRGKPQVPHYASRRSDGPG